MGSIKWLERAPFDDRDLTRLVQHRSQLPGATSETPLVASAGLGCDVAGVTVYEPADLFAAVSPARAR